MKILQFSNNEDWMLAREGRITGTKVKGLISKRDGSPLKGFWDLIKDKLAVKGDENRIDRGIRLEEEAINRFESETGKKAIYDKVIICRDDDQDIAYSPDALVEGENASIEVKCLDSSVHVQAMFTNKLPKEYEEQSIQPFVVNDELETLYFVFYDPNFVKDFFFFTIKREEIASKIEEQLKLCRDTLQKIREIEQQLTF